MEKADEELKKKRREADDAIRAAMEKSRIRAIEAADEELKKKQREADDGIIAAIEKSRIRAIEAVRSHSENSKD